MTSVRAEQPREAGAADGVSWLPSAAETRTQSGAAIEAKSGRLVIPASAWTARIMAIGIPGDAGGCLKGY